LKDIDEYVRNVSMIVCLSSADHFPFIGGAPGVSVAEGAEGAVDATDCAVSYMIRTGPSEL
jgi:hypothetical protein